MKLVLEVKPFRLLSSFVDKIHLPLKGKERNFPHKYTFGIGTKGP